jgi:hypothetical protein
VSALQKHLLEVRDAAIRAAGDKLAAAGVSKWNRVLEIARALSLVASSRFERPDRVIAEEINRAFAANSGVPLARSQIARILDGHRNG